MLVMGRPRTLRRCARAARPCMERERERDIGGCGEESARSPQPGNLFLFRFVFVSCVRASGRGEAAWACGASVSSTLVARLATFPAAAAAAPVAPGCFAFFVFVDSCMGLKGFSLILLTVAWVLRVFLGFVFVFVDSCMGFKGVSLILLTVTLVLNVFL